MRTYRTIQRLGVGGAVLALAACAPLPPKQVQIEAFDQGRPVVDARCVARWGAASWELSTPGRAPVGDPSGPQTLRVRCSKAGYADSEWAQPAEPSLWASPWGEPWGLGCDRLRWRHGMCSWGPGSYERGWRYPDRVRVEMTPLP